MNKEYIRQLEKNIGKYSWYKIFTKRVYLPLITIQLVNVGKVTVAQLAIIATLSSALSLILQVPSGYVADKWGNRRAIIFGTGISAISPLFYVISPNFIGGLTAALIFFGGASFYTGAIEAFMHDTLVELGRESQYAKVMGKAQSYGLIGNIVLITAVPATYSVNHALPFVLGFLSLVVMFLLSISFTYPTSQKSHVEKRNPFVATKNIITKQNIAIFIFAGAMAGVVNRGAEYNVLLFQSIGIKVVYFGAIAAAGSVVGAVMGRYLQALDRLKPVRFYFVDFSFIGLCLIIAASTRSPALAILGFTLFAGYSRVRLILVQAKLLSEMKHTYKATLLSSLNLFSTIGEIISITFLSRLIGLKGFVTGYLWFGFLVLAVGFLMWMMVARLYKTSELVAASLGEAAR